MANNIAEGEQGFTISNSFGNFFSQPESGDQRRAASNERQENQQQLISEEEEGNLENRRVAVIVCD